MEIPRRCIRIAVARTTRPATASTEPTAAGAVYPKPAAITAPPMAAPRALARLKAAWLSEAAKVCASSATSIRRVYRPGMTDEPEAPIRKIRINAVTPLWAAATNTARNTAIADSPKKTPRSMNRSASQPPA